MKSQDCYTAKEALRFLFSALSVWLSTSIGVAQTFGLSEQSLVHRFSEYSHLCMSSNIPDSVVTTLELMPMGLHLKNGAKPRR